MAILTNQGTETASGALIFADASCTAYCALYDAYGKLLKRAEDSISPGEQEIRFDTAGDFDTAKIFLLDAAFTPLCEALTLKAA